METDPNIAPEKIMQSLRAIGLDEDIAAELTKEAIRSINARKPRLHSDLTVHEAQDWLAANDCEGADYWRAQPLTDDLIAAVGERLMVLGKTKQLVFDSDWQERYLNPPSVT